MTDDEDLCTHDIWRGHANLQSKACKVTCVLEDVIAKKVDGHRFVVFSRDELNLNIQCDNKAYTKDVLTLRLTSF